MPREMRLAARSHGGGPTYFNVTEQFLFITEQFLFTHCKQRVGLQAGNAEDGLVRGSLVNMM